MNIGNTTHRVEVVFSVSQGLAEILENFTRDHAHRHFQVLNESLNQIMSVISTFITEQRTHNARVSSALDGISTDLSTLAEKIANFVASPEDLQALAELQVAGEALAARAEQLDAINPPTPPPTT